MLAPPTGNHAYLLERVEDLAIEQLVAQAGIEAFNVAVLPGTTWFDEQRLHPHLAEPVTDRSGRELRAVI